VYVEQGYGRLATGDYRGPLAPGSVAVLCAGTLNDMGPRPEDPMEITWLAIEGEDFPRLAAAAGLTAARPHAAIGAAPEPRAIFRELRQARPGSIWRAQSLFWALLARIALAAGRPDMGAPPAAATPVVAPPDAPGRPVAPPPTVPPAEALAADDPAVARAVDLARLHLDEPDLRLSHLAGAARLGRSRFVQRFRLATGTSPRRYLELLRMEEARRLLEDGAPVGRAARQAGFSDPLYFSRRFHALHGLPPSSYQAVARGSVGGRRPGSPYDSPVAPLDSATAGSYRTGRHGPALTRPTRTRDSSGGARGR
jgi:AraC-like DNA-binding protein